MDALTTLLEELKKSGAATGHFRGLLHVLIGRRISKKGGSVISTGITWRELANLLQKLRWEPEAVEEIGIDPEELPPRDRLRFWYGAIARARVDSPEAEAAGDRFATLLKNRGYEVGPAPRSEAQ